MNTYVPNEHDIIHTTKVDFVGRSATEFVHLVQGDDELPIVAIDLFVNGLSFVIPNNIIDIKVNNKNILGISEDRKRVFWKATQDITRLKGIHQMVVTLYKANDSFAGSSSFYIDVEPKIA